MIRNENYIVSSMRAFLKAKRYKVLSFARTHEHGFDVLAQRGRGRKLAVEAKGEGRARKNSGRFRKTFTKNQVNDHVGRAILKVLHIKRKYRFGVALAFPDNRDHRAEVEPIFPYLKLLGIRVFFVRTKRRVIELTANV